MIFSIFSRYGTKSTIFLICPGANPFPISPATVHTASISPSNSPIGITKSFVVSKNIFPSTVDLLPFGITVAVSLNVDSVYFILVVAACGGSRFIVSFKNYKRLSRYFPSAKLGIFCLAE